MESYIRFFISFVLLLSPLFSQTKTIDRQFVPMIHQILNETQLYGLNVEEWSAFRYHRDADTWSAIPFQFDQMDDRGEPDEEADGLLDATDELVVMPEDLGDQAETWAWIDDAESKVHHRFELEMADPLNPDKKGWLYLFRRAPGNVPGYMTYIPGPTTTPAADTISTHSFKLGHDANGWIDYMSFHQGLNLFDRFKLRLAGNSFLVPAYEINEDFVKGTSDPTQVTFTKGPVRSFHETAAVILIEKLNLPLLPDEAKFDYKFDYTPYTFHIYAKAEDLDSGLLALFGVKTVRQSLDFNSNAKQMLFYSDDNRNGIVIDGISDSPTLDFSESSERNWVMATGDQGTVIVFFAVSLRRNLKKVLYYRDNSDGGGSNDGTQDTGDMRSFGDMGLLIQATGDALLPPEDEKLWVDYKGYFIDQPNMDASIAEQLSLWEDNQLSISLSTQTYDASFVAENQSSPGEFHLLAAYPNPYPNSKASGLNFRISGRITETYDLEVYNILGQRVAVFSQLTTPNSGILEIHWDGKDLSGETLTPGIYLYRLTNGLYAETKKLVIQ